MLQPQFIAEMKQLLEEQQAKLIIDLQGLDAHVELGTDSDENAQEVENDEVNQDLMARMRDDLEKVEVALAKIDDGTYGVDSNGKEISEDRLRVIPWADKAI